MSENKKGMRAMVEVEWWCIARMHIGDTTDSNKRFEAGPLCDDNHYLTLVISVLA